MLLAEIGGHDGELEGLLVCLVVVILVTAVVFFVGRQLAPAYAGIAAFVILLLGALLCLL
jgi:hypothetical protein